jgi:hypothetical protein
MHDLFEFFLWIGAALASHFFCAFWGDEPVFDIFLLVIIFPLTLSPLVGEDLAKEVSKRWKRRKALQ